MIYGMQGTQLEVISTRQWIDGYTLKDKRPSLPGTAEVLRLLSQAIAGILKKDVSSYFNTVFPRIGDERRSAVTRCKANTLQVSTKQVFARLLEPQ